MIRLFLSLLAVTLLFTPASAERLLPHLRLDLPSTVEELEARYRSARAHITPEVVAANRARARHRTTIQSGLAPRVDAWFANPAAARAAREACAAGDQGGCVALAELAVDEAQELVDEPLAYALSVMACEAGYGPGCDLFHDRAWAYYLTEYETLFPSNDYFHDACADGEAEACRRLGEIWSGYKTHRDVELDADKGQAFFKLACDLGSDTACGRVKQPEVSPEDAFANDMDACTEGDASKCYMAGYSLLSGRGVEPDTAEGLELLERSCAGGNGRGCHFTARFFESGQFFPADAAKALAYHERACEAGSHESCVYLAGIYADGVGVPQSSETAQIYRDKACMLRACPKATTIAGALAELQESLDPIEEEHRMEAALALSTCVEDDPAGCKRLGVLLGNVRDTRATTVLDHACDLGDAPACVSIGRKGLQGRGLVAFQRACDLGHLPGCTMRVERDSGMPADKKRAQLDGLCDRGEGGACQMLGEAYAGSDYVGLAVGEDLLRALGYFERACEFETFRSCSRRAEYEHPDHGGDFSQMLAILEDGCARGGASPCERLGLQFLFGEFVEPDLEKAWAYFKRGCEVAAGAPACEEEERLRLALERRDLRERLGGFEAALVERPEDFRPYYQAPARRARAACAAGQTDQCIVLAGLYQTYEALAQEGRDDDHARGIYVHLCEAGDPEACYRFGYSHESRGEESRHDLSLTFYTRACDLGHGAACVAAGFLYELGDDATGGADDHETAGEYYLRACGLGHARGCDGLSSLFDVGEPKKSAFDLVACLGGDGQACGFIADDYRKGRRSVPKDKEMARVLYGYGCDFGDEGACYNHRKLGGG